MFCCCPQDTNPEQDPSHKGSSTTPTPAQPAANIQAGKGPVSHNQNTNVGAKLEKTTVEAAKRESSPVTEQPVVQSTIAVASSQIQSNPVLKDNNPVKSDSKPVELSDVEAQIVNVKNSTSQVVSQATSKAKTEATAKTASVVSEVKQAAGSIEPPKVDTKLVSSAMQNIEQLKSVNSDLDKLDKAIGEAETKSNSEAKASVPKLANQLKALTSQVLSGVGGSGNMADKAIQAAVSRLEAVASRLEALAAKSSGMGNAAGGDSDAVSPFVQAYDDLVSGSLAKFLTLSNDIGGDIKTQAGLVKQAFDAQRDFLVVVSKSKQPDQNTFVELLKPSATKLQEVQDFRENNRRSEYFNHLSAISESVAALGWVTVSPAPGPYVKEMADAGTFYTNRVLKDYKEKDPKHVEWSRSWIATLNELQAYIKQFHTTGLTWNAQGGDAKSVKTSGSASTAAAPPAGGAPPPPPPGGPPPPPPPSVSKGDDDSATRAALFAELNKGTDITKSLKKVSDDMKTHKNPLLRLGAAPFKPGGPKPASGVKAHTTPAKPPLIELQGKKWIVEYHKDNKNIVIDQTELKQSVYAFRCEGCTIQVKGKINSIILDSCKKTAIVFDGLVSSLEFVNCQSMQAQVTGSVPTVSIDKTDGCQVYLSEQSLNCEIVSAKSSEMNILVPKGGGDFKEFALPEQFKTKYDGKTMVTTASDAV